MAEFQAAKNLARVVLRESLGDADALVAGTCVGRMNGDLRSKLLAVLHDLAVDVPPLVPWSALQKQSAYTKASSFLDSWDESKALDWFRKSQPAVDTITEWTPVVERNVMTSTATSRPDILALASIGLHWRGGLKQQWNVLCGKPCKLRDIKKDKDLVKYTDLQGTFLPSNYLVATAKGWLSNTSLQRKPASFVSTLLPSTSLCASIVNQTVTVKDLTSKKPGFAFATSIASPDYIDSEILSSGTVLLTVGTRNMETGGLVYQESFAFQFDDSTNLVSHTLSEEEKNDARAHDLRKQSKQSPYNLQDENSPLSLSHDDLGYCTVSLHDETICTFAFPCAGVLGTSDKFLVLSYSGFLINEKKEFFDVGLPCEALLPWI